MPKKRARKPVVQAADAGPPAPAPLPSPPGERFDYRLAVGALAVVAVVASFGLLRSRPQPVPARSTAAAVLDAGTGVRSDDLVVTTATVSIPDEVMPDRDWAVPLRWRLPGYSRERALGLLSDVDGVDTRLHCDATGCAVLPPVASVIALPTASRSRIYSVLALIDGNPQAGDTFYRTAQLGPFSGVPGIPDEIRPMMDTLTWHRDGIPAFTDIAAVCSRLTAPGACRGFMRAMLSRPSATVQLRLPDQSAVERVVSVFVESEQSAVRQRLSAARAVGQVTYPLNALLPPWAQSRLGTFPAAGEEWTNCFWTALRFVDRAPGVVADTVAMDGVLQREFDRVSSAARFGDVVILRDTEGRALHSATWLLGGFLFEKNGYGRLQAWRVVPMSQVMMEYPSATTIERWRRRA